MDEFELACRMWLEAKNAGLRLKPLPAETVRDFLDHSGYRPRCAWLTQSEEHHG